MVITTDVLKQNTYGVPCGVAYSASRESCMSNQIVIDYIDKYFGGSLGECNVYENEIGYASPVISCMMDNADLQSLIKQYYTDDNDISSLIRDIEYYAEYDDVNYDDLNIDYIENFDISQYPKLSPKLICHFFQVIINHLDGSIRCEHYYDNVEFESE